jgi:hypothetical protein
LRALTHRAQPKRVISMPDQGGRALPARLGDGVEG